MPNLIIQENNVNRIRPAVHGEELTIVAPCNCSEVSGVQIAGVAYPFYDAAGNVLESGTGWFAQGSLIRVLIDVDNTRAYILNAAIKGFVESMVGGNTGGTIQKVNSSEDAPVVLRDLESGVYILNGVFAPYSGSAETVTFGYDQFVCVDRNGTEGVTAVQVMNPVDYTVSFYTITDNDFINESSSLRFAEDATNRDSVIDDTAADDHYPSTLAVKNYVDSLVANIITVNVVESADDIPSDAAEGSYYVVEG